MRYRFACPLRWGDMDAFGHVNNVRYLSYLEEARTHMLFAGEAAQQMPKLLDGVVVARHEIDYLRPLAWRPEPIAVDVWVSRIRAASFTLGYEILDVAALGEEGGATVARATSELVPFDIAAGRPRRLDGEERAFLERLTDE